MHSRIQILFIQIAFCSGILFQTKAAGQVNTTIQAAKIEEFKTAINRQFTKATTGTAFSNFGNFASVGSDAKTFTLGINSVNSKGNILGVELSGGASEGLFKIFTNQKLNSSFSGEFKYHLLRKVDFAARNYLDNVEFDNQAEDARNQFRKDSMEIMSKRELYKLVNDSVTNALKISDFQKLQFKADSVLKNTPGLLEYKQDSIRNAITFRQAEILNLQMGNRLFKQKIEKIQADSETYFETEYALKAKALDSKLTEIKKKKINQDLSGISFSWFSFGLRVKNNDLRLYDPTLSSQSKFKDTAFISQRFSAAVTKYKSTSYENRDYYWSTGIYIDYTTNVNTLKKVEIEERTTVPGNPDQSIKKTINAYQGEYKEAFWDVTLYTDYYRFIGKYNSVITFHLNPSLNFSGLVNKPITNIWLGLIIPFVEKEKQASKLNLEIFYSKEDVFNYLRKQVGNSQLGIRATLPITMLNFKQ